MAIELPRIYPITDRELAGISHAEQVRELAKAGASLIQLREKAMSSGDLLREASAAAAAAREFGARILINDRADIALMSGAAGVHLGQTDMPPYAARQLLGPDALIGFSTHSVEQAIEAARMPIDYIAIGPIFDTTTKESAGPAVGTTAIEAVRRAIGEMPLIAIGGIDGPRAGEVLRAGADSIAVISALFRGGLDIASNFRSLTAATTKNI